MRALAISPEDVATALRNANARAAGGTIRRGQFRYAVRTLTEFQDIAEIQRVPVGPARSGITLGDIATVTLTTAEPETLTQLDGAAAVGLVVGIFPLGAGLLVFLDPLRGKKRAPASVPDSGEGFLKIATLDAVPDDGVPRRFPVVADLTDAWNFSPGQPVGAVYLRREKGKKEVQVFHATCPHAGCSVTPSVTTSG